MWKNIAALTVEDLAACPVWEWRKDGEAEVVRPTTIEELSEPFGQSPVYLAATEFLAANGETYLGYCSPADPSGLDYVQPVILVQNGAVPLWNEDSAKVDRAAVCSALGRTPAQVFPLTVRCLVPTANGTYGEIVHGT